MTPALFKIFFWQNSLLVAGRNAQRMWRTAHALLGQRVREPMPDNHNNNAGQELPSMYAMIFKH